MFLLSNQDNELIVPVFSLLYTLWGHRNLVLHEGYQQATSELWSRSVSLSLEMRGDSEGLEFENVPRFAASADPCF